MTHNLFFASRMRFHDIFSLDNFSHHQFINGQILTRQYLTRQSLTRTISHPDDFSHDKFSLVPFHVRLFLTLYFFSCFGTIFHLFGDNFSPLLRQFLTPFATISRPLCDRFTPFLRQFLTRFGTISHPFFREMYLNSLFQM